MLNHLAICIVFLTILLPETCAITDPYDVDALRDLYQALHSPEQLNGWNSTGNDPCEESWTGVFCSGSQVIYLNLHGLNLSGSLGDQIFDLQNLRKLDISSNNIQGEIPYRLPPNITFINLSCNNFISNIPVSISSIQSLLRLNLSQNSLSGPIGNVFNGLKSLKELDLSNNDFTGNLPSSFEDLTNLTRLYLQNNSFTGSVTYLAHLPLSHLNIEDNHFSGAIPEQFENIQNLWFGGNIFHSLPNDKPWNFPLETVPYEQDVSVPEITQSSSVESYVPKKQHVKRSKMGPGGITCIIGGGTLLVSCVGLLIAIQINGIRFLKFDRSLGGSNISLDSSRPATTIPGCSYDTSYGSSEILPIRSPGMPSTRMIDKIYCSSFSNIPKMSTNEKLYTMHELQLATNGFGKKNILGEGSLGYVYKAEFPDGKMFVVKNIKTVSLTKHEEEQFLDAIWRAARLRHANIVTLAGYCIEHGQHMLVYDYVKSCTLEEALHCGALYTRLSWTIRLRIAIGIARALEYMHSAFSQPVPHCNLKAANIMLDEDLSPKICDCGLAILRAFASDSVKVKASELAIGNSGYVAPEHALPGIDGTKSDVYAYGVILLELLTGRRAFDSSRAAEERYLVKWGKSQLSDRECLEEMIDPSMNITFLYEDVSEFADIVSICIQDEKEQRPPMHRVVELMGNLLHNNIGREERKFSVDTFERSFHSTKSIFNSSP